jgi:Flp pilus assembly protein CpaB
MNPGEVDLCVVLRNEKGALTTVATGVVGIDGWTNPGEVDLCVVLRNENRCADHSCNSSCWDGWMS